MANKYINANLWRATKDQSTFFDAAAAHQSDLQNPKAHQGLECRHHPVVDSTLGGIPFVLGAVCALASMYTCPDIEQAIEMYALGHLIGDGVPLAVEATLDHFFGG
jgi:hypothetical protein